jgi:hypothetical protein
MVKASPLWLKENKANKNSELKMLLGRFFAIFLHIS